MIILDLLTKCFSERMQDLLPFSKKNEKSLLIFLKVSFFQKSLFFMINKRDNLKVDLSQINFIHFMKE